MSHNIDHLEQISEIRKMMEKSSRFLSLSGLSGVSAGIFALAGSISAWFILRNHGLVYDENYRDLSGNASSGLVLLLAGLAILVLMAALGSALYFSWRKARKKDIPFWTPVTGKLLIDLMIPLFTGGILIVILIWQNNLNLLAPLSLIFYGLGLINAGKFISIEISWLGATEIATGLLATIFQPYSLFFWAFGFGLMHIVYGAILYFRYDK